MEKQNRIPELRFPEFKGEWEKMKLGEVSQNISSGKSDQKINEGTYPFYGSTGLIGYSNKSDYLGKKILIARVGANAGSIYIVEGNYCVTDNTLILDLERNAEVDFIFNYLISKNLNKLVFGSGQPLITAGHLKLLEIQLPSFDEQTKIASFLTAVDDKLQTLKKKKSFIEQYKKGVLQKIFNQDIRFKDDNGNEFPEWEKKRLDYVITRFIVPMRDKPKELIGEIPWCRIEDFDGKYLLTSKSNQGVTSKTVKEMNLKIYPINTLLVSCSANLGFCAIVKKELITNQTFIGLVPDLLKINVEFLYYLMKLSAHKLNILSSGTTISYLSREQFEKFIVNTPNIIEQTKIANFLSSIDDKIISVDSQIKKTELFKKGLLQRMFV